jgi:hypothetical protein
MRLLASVFLTCLALSAEPRLTFHIVNNVAGNDAGSDAGSWPELLSSLGLTADVSDNASLAIATHAADLPIAEWTSRMDRGAILVLEGDSPIAQALGFKPSSAALVPTRSVEDLRDPELRIVWEKSLDLPVFQIPPQARVFARERWRKAPLVAGYRRGKGAVLWVAAPLGTRAYDRFPYMLQALTDLGFEPPFQSRRMWAFFDSAYRSRVDLDYLAARWRASGVSALHVAAWHFWERDPQSDEYLRRLIEACHQNAIVVYAWVELPHVSERFWEDHPAWREKTALLQDAQLDWRKLMNLSRPEAFAAVSAGLRDLVTTFDWDGVNLAELYFESLEGAGNPARFTPMNSDVRAEFQHDAGIDPLELFQSESPRHWTRNSAGLARFLDYRAEMAWRQQAAWIGEVEIIRKTKPHLDLALTHVDDRFDPSVRDKLGADSARVLPLLGQHDFTFLIEDPATIWNQGPRRYPQIAARYASLTPAQEKLAIDVNIVERYQDVYPTKALAGSELIETIHAASAAFPRVTLYFESSISRSDAPLLGPAAASVDYAAEVGGRLIVQSKHGVGVPWKRPVTVDGKLWPVTDGSVLWLPSGSHVVENAAEAPAARILDFNGDLRDATIRADGGLEFLYESSSRAFAILDPAPQALEIDGKLVALETVGRAIVLPRGTHSVIAYIGASTGAHMAHEPQASPSPAPPRAKPKTNTAATKTTLR